MGKRELLYLLSCLLALNLMVSCEKDNETTSVTDDDKELVTEADEEEVEVRAQFQTIVADAMLENMTIHEDSGDDDWDTSSEIQITLNGNSIDASADGLTVSGTTLTIASSGNYRLSGTLSDGQIIVDSDDEEIVRLILDGVDVNCSTNAPLVIASAEKTVIILPDGTHNQITDATDYVFDDPDEDEPNAALFSKDNLSIYGSGSLTVNANYNDGISSKDGLIIGGGTINVTSVDDGIRGKDYLVIEDGDITLDVDGDGLKSDNDDDIDAGFIYMMKGTLSIVSGGDAVQAETDALIEDGTITISSGGGSSKYLSDDSSAKGIKAGVNVIIESGTFIINSADDALHCNGNLVINDGIYSIATGDDGIHADSTLAIYTGTIDITESYEGIESSSLMIGGGNIHIVSSDDGINGAGGNDESGTQDVRGPDNFNTSGDNYLYIYGGYIYVDADGDGIDVNGSIVMNGGTVLVNGPVNDGNSALDYDVSFQLTGGFLLAAGSSGMAQAPDNTSAQPSVMVTFKSALSSGTLFHIQNNKSEDVVTFSPSKTYESVVFSSPDLKEDNSYVIYYGGNSTGTETDGLYNGGTYTPGTQYGGFTISDMVTRIN